MHQFKDGGVVALDRKTFSAKSFTLAFPIAEILGDVTTAAHGHHRIPIGIIGCRQLLQQAIALTEHCGRDFEFNGDVSPTGEDSAAQAM